MRNGLYWLNAGKSNYAFNPIAEQSLRSNQTIVPQRVNAALGISMGLLRTTLSLALAPAVPIVLIVAFVAVRNPSVTPGMLLSEAFLFMYLVPCYLSLAMTASHLAWVRSISFNRENQLILELVSGKSVAFSSKGLREDVVENDT